MNNRELINKLTELKGHYHGNEKTVIRIEHLLDLIDRMPDSVIEVIQSVKYFLSTQENPSCTDANLNDVLDAMIEETRSYFKEKRKTIQETAVVEMRKSRKGFVIAAIVVLSFIAGVAAVLGVLGAIGKISGAYCDIVGIIDCTLGITFFMYELYTDRLNESKINSGDEEKIKKHIKEIPIKIEKQTNISSQVNNGIVFGSMTMNTVSDPTEISTIISKLFSEK